MTYRMRRRPSRVLQLLALTGAGFWSVGLLVAATTVPAYQSSTSGLTGSGSSRSISSHGETLVDVNGKGVLIALAVPLLATLVVAGALLIRRRWSIWIACVTTGLLALGNLAAMLTVGVLVLPVTAALVVGCLCEVLGPPPPDQGGLLAT